MKDLASPARGRPARVGASGLILNEPLIFERSSPGRRAYSLSPPQDGLAELSEVLPSALCREEIPGFPEVSEMDLVRHYTRLAGWNYSVDHGLYPLGSCTMKYNPKVNEDVAAMAGFARLHPYQEEEACQGALALLWELDLTLREITGMDRMVLQPTAGAQGELTGMMLIRAYLTDQGNPRKKVLLPDSAHGTNPASSTLCGYEVVEIKSDERGLMNPKALETAMDDETAALMLTNPNTLGLFEEDIEAICQIVHDRGGFVYCDGANMNALMGIARMGDMGMDVIQLNLHKTFSTPHGGGGPGAGPVGVKKILEPYLPVPVIEKRGERYRFNYDISHSIGKVRSFYGNFGILVRAYTYICSMGRDGLKRASQMAVLNANYLSARLKERYHLTYDRTCMHECVLSDKHQQAHGVRTSDIAKRLMDYGFHPPTIYFPLIVKGAMMIEPTETESRETLDEFIEAMLTIADEAERAPGLIQSAPHFPKTSRLDEVKAAREPVLRWQEDSPP